MGDAQGLCSPSGTVDAGWVITREIGEPGDAWRREKSRAVSDPDQIVAGLVGEWGCVRNLALVDSGGLKQEDFIFKKSSQLLFGELSHSSRHPPPSLHCLFGGAQATAEAQPLRHCMAGLIRGRRRRPAEDGSRVQGVSSPWSDLTRWGS